MPTIENRLKAYIETLPESKLKAAMAYALLGGGKRIRPMLGMTLLESKGVDPTPYIEAFLAVEMIHTYSLIHDDLPAMDDDTLRRGKPTVHIAFDEAIAILAGDALLTDSFRLVTQNKYLSTLQKVEIIDIISSKAGSTGMVFGQIKDIESEDKMVTIEDLNLMYELKTANLIQASLMIAGVILSDHDIKSYEDLGYYIGLIFQIQDDILEYTLSPEEFGKSKSDDIRNKPTYVSLLGLDKANQVLNTYVDTLNTLIESLYIKDTVIHTQIKLLLNRRK
ncbi:polyprenyl synthetase family protein [Acholeplasma laidlawii]|uniref:Geranyltranstransferase n=2 Tax=Acholeplasma laidlawii TaxID=2148 RepID=A9NHU2_ACHLI|nr:farnesyl diphosphate synthase [Acholeplasma laidlawii]ABX81922.1 geranyltranstransferase [Acholeplasma laidlawii PG-8A]NWH10904.1 polyprenyl synthetase family protein [Acholeplasma laidlawii]NWH12290.1 polyprenyl synthetase family protein [Acholeplasma laidlawii]NWH13676.1 polyprenyl synthetase family protein [Acholeplasma laidlawii]NWH15001.1 polyprenyl synthetase family protein [Acholeplasma laidlawii]